MPRVARLQFEGAFYHVIHRGNRREPIFLDDQDYAKFEACMLEARTRSGVQLYSWKQMPNHFHLLVETPFGNLAEFMQRLLTRYSMYFNWRHGLVGHVFQGRYGARICDKEAYFKELIRYIQLNAYRTEGTPLAPLGTWKWSSHRYLMMPESQWPDGLQKAFRTVLDSFHSDPNRARVAVASFLAEGLKSGNWKDFYKVKGSQWMADEKFIEKVKAKTGQSVREKPRLMMRLKTVQELAEEVVKISGISREAFASKDQGQLLSRWRKALVFIGRSRYRFSINALAEVIGRDPSSVSQMLRRLPANQTSREIEHLSERLAR